MNSTDRSSDRGWASRPPKRFAARCAIRMHLMYYLDAEGKRVYTLKKETPEGAPTVSAHPGEFARSRPADGHVLPSARSARHSSAPPSPPRSARSRIPSPRIAQPASRRTTSFPSSASSARRGEDLGAVRSFGEANIRRLMHVRGVARFGLLPGQKEKR